MSLHDTDMTQNAPAVDEDRLAELQLALGLQDIETEGFEAGVRRACVAAGFVFLFDLPTIDDSQISRVAAAVTESADGAPVFAYVSLSSDDEALRVDDECMALDHAEAVASAYLDLMVLH